MGVSFLCSFIFASKTSMLWQLDCPIALHTGSGPMRQFNFVKGTKAFPLLKLVTILECPSYSHIDTANNFYFRYHPPSFLFDLSSVSIRVRHIGYLNISLPLLSVNSAKKSGSTYIIQAFTLPCNLFFNYSTEKHLGSTYT